MEGGKIKQIQDSNINLIHTYESIQKQKPNSQKSSQKLKQYSSHTQNLNTPQLHKNYQLDPYTYVNSIPLDDYIYDLRYIIFPGIPKNVLKEFLYYLFHFDRSNKALFSNFHTFIQRYDIYGAINFLKSVINIDEVKSNFQKAISLYGVVPEETKDLNTILTLYVNTENPALARKLFRYLLYIDFKSREKFNNYIEQYLNYKNDEIRDMSISDNIYSAYKL